MAHGLSLVMREITFDDDVVPRETRPRDRSLRGKARRNRAVALEAAEKRASS